MDSIQSTCTEISEVLRHINSTISACIPPPADNLYMKLYDGLNYFQSFICNYDEKSKVKHICNYIDCLKELREDLIDCEGPPDWFENTNEPVVCQFFNDIINCNYIQAAMLCGLKPALMLRSFTAEVLKKVVLSKCQVSRSLPHVEEPMPSTGVAECSSDCCCIFILFICYILLNKY